MPHECTNCNRTFPDGSKEMLSGCPDCGGNKFRYRPSGATDADPGADATGDGPAESTPDPPTNPAESGSVADAVRGATTTVRDWVGRGGGDGPPGTGDRSPGSGRGDPSSGTGSGDRSSGSGGSDDPATPDPAGSPAAGEGDPASDPDPSAEPAAGQGWEEVPQSGDPPSSGGTGDATDETPGVPDDAERVDAGEPGAGGPDAEDTAQASARTSMVHPEELPDPSEDPADVGPTPGSSPGSDALAPGPPTTGRDPDGPDTRREAEESTDPPVEGTTDPPAEGPTDSPPGESGDPPAGRPSDDGSGDGADLAELRQELNDQFESIKIVEPGQYELNLMELYDREEYIISLMEDGRYAIEVPETWRGDGP